MTYLKMEQRDILESVQRLAFGHISFLDRFETYLEEGMSQYEFCLKMTNMADLIERRCFGLKKRKDWDEDRFGTLHNLTVAHWSLSRIVAEEVSKGDFLELSTVTDLMRDMARIATVASGILRNATN